MTDEVDGTVIVPGFGSEYLNDLSISHWKGRYYVTGTYRENEGTYEDPYYVEMSLTVPVSCIRSTWPVGEPWPRETP